MRVQPAWLYGRRGRCWWSFEGMCGCNLSRISERVVLLTVWGAIFVISLISLLLILTANASFFNLAPPHVSQRNLLKYLLSSSLCHISDLFNLFSKNPTTPSNSLDSYNSLWVSSIFLTSITTAVGFLSLNFSDSPPFHDLGNITAAGVMAAWLFSVMILPILMSFVTVKPKETLGSLNNYMGKMGEFISSKYKAVLIISIFISVLVTAAITRNEINDDFLKYFDEDITFRADTDWISQNLTGLNQIQFDMAEYVYKKIKLN